MAAMKENFFERFCMYPNMIYLNITSSTTGANNIVYKGITGSVVKTDASVVIPSMLNDIVFNIP
ncbi:cytosol aminopeptidase [Paenibacillus sp. NAIST15-1]|nr:cytosol aminopeptidase [Paenibacillus sp. NAIST15-1]